MNKPEAGEISLLAAILRGQPALDGSCKSHHVDSRWFDADARPHDKAQALKICSACPVRRQCNDFAMSDDSGIVSGTIDGVFLATPEERPSPTQRGGSCNHESGCDVRHYAKGLCQRHYREAENRRKRERNVAAKAATAVAS